MKLAFLFAVALLVMCVSSSAYSVPSSVNITVDNGNVTVMSGLYNQSFNGTSLSFSFSFSQEVNFTNTTIYVSNCSSLNLTTTTTSVDYDRIRQNTFCQTGNLTCPDPVCPEPFCPTPSCPSLDYDGIYSAIENSSFTLQSKIVEMNESLSSVSSSSSVRFKAEYLVYIGGVLLVLFVFKDKIIKLFSRRRRVLSNQVQMDESVVIDNGNEHPN